MVIFVQLMNLSVIDIDTDRYVDDEHMGPRRVLLQGTALKYKTFIV